MENIREVIFFTCLLFEFGHKLGLSSKITPVIIFFVSYVETSMLCCKTFPPVSSLDPDLYGDPKSSITEDDLEPLLEGFSVKEVMMLSSFSKHFKFRRRKIRPSFMRLRIFSSKTKTLID